MNRTPSILCLAAILSVACSLTATVVMTQTKTNTVMVSAFTSPSDSPCLLSRAYPAVDSGLNLASAATVEISASGMVNFGSQSRLPNQSRLVGEFLDAAGNPISLYPILFPNRLLCETYPSHNPACTNFFPIIGEAPVSDPDRFSIFTSNALPVPANAKSLIFALFDPAYSDKSGQYEVTTTLLSWAEISVKVPDGISALGNSVDELPDGSRRP